MTSADELFALYQQWRTLTEDEGEAIEIGDWPSVEQYQTAKTRLQPRIVELSHRLGNVTHEQRFRGIIEELMQLERRNGALLQRRRQAADEQMGEMDRASRHLRQIHKSYVPPARTHWQSYS
jgi:hypothetical protein